jgi:hypothetical protein
MVVNQTDGYPDIKKPGMQIRSITIESIESADPAKAAAIAEIAKGDRLTWDKNLSGKRGLQRLEKIFALLFGVTNMVEHRRVESHGASFSFISVRVP